MKPISFFFATVICFALAPAAASASYGGEMENCIASSRLEKNQNLCMERKMLTMILDASERLGTKDPRLRIVNLGCKHVSKVPDMFLGGLRGLRAAFEDGGMGIDKDVQQECFLNAASFLDQNQEPTFTLQKQVDLLKLVCATATDSKSELETYTRRAQCYRYGGKDPFNRTELSQRITDIDSSCRLDGVMRGEGTIRSAEEFLLSSYQCLDQKIGELGTRANPSISAATGVR